MEIPPPLEIDFVSMAAEVSGALRTTLQPVSRFCPAPANVIPVNVQELFLPERIDIG